MATEVRVAARATQGEVSLEIPAEGVAAMRALGWEVEEYIEVEVEVADPRSNLTIKELEALAAESDPPVDLTGLKKHDDILAAIVAADKPE